MSREWIGVDLDGTLAVWNGWVRWFDIGEPIPAMIERVRGWLAEGKDVRIMTARVCPLDDSYAVRVHRCRTTGQMFSCRDMVLLIQDYTEKHVGARLPVTCVKDLYMTQLWDDRAIGVERNTGRTLTDAAVADVPSEDRSPRSGVLIRELKEYDISYRYEEAVEQLARYGGEPDERVVPVIEALASLNDDLAHLRHRDIIVEKITAAKDLLDAIVTSQQEGDSL